ncbi:4,5-dihydroxyphthalate decarboxylase [Rhizodiscina lignyota]|uniref:4,5-dihydroxyphthalate decarboxylase n=1 Tax=Rhizodiscina lignyota TaxID=1504668 RepID=A0A9P4I493_9PEZI|nr:4,5-dihydroxyphthalate decarboxylase [Rhizodiscina lignyota]
MVLKLSFACWDYDRFKAIEDGRVRPEGIELTFLNYRVEETFFRQLRFREFDVSELSLSSYVLTLNQDNPPFIALPVFASRYFRHQSMYINTNSGIKKPSDLRGKRIGSPEYQMTAPVWQRGIMEDEFGVPINSVEWFVGAIEPSPDERISKVWHSVPADVKITAIERGKNLSQMLADGELDAIFSATKPSSFDGKTITHLFPNFKEVEAEYYQRTKIFPIMHVIALKRDVYDANPWIAKVLQKAFEKAMDIGYEALEERAALRYMLPWLDDHYEETQRLFGEKKYWKDGFDENKHVLEKFLEYSFNQGLAKRKFKPEELFAPNTLESYVL